MFARDGFALLLTSPVTWFLYFLLVYAITGSGCTLGFASTQIVGISIVRVLAVGAGALFAIVIAINGVLALRRWKALRDDGDAIHQQLRFAQLAAALLSAASLLGVGWLMTTVLINPLC